MAKATTDRSGTQLVSRDTAYRLWPDPGAVVVDVAHHLAAIGTSGVDRVIESARAVFDPPSPLTPEDGDDGPPREEFRDVLVRNFELQFTTVDMPAGWFLQAAAMTSSPLWQGAKPDDDLLGLGQEILRIRADLYDRVTQRWAVPLRNAISTYGRRPKHPYTVEMIVQLMNALFDGCLLRFFVDPNLNDPTIDEDERRTQLDWVIRLASDAMIELAIALTEDGSQDDPRRPVTPAAQRLFDDVVTTAKEAYAQHREVVALTDEDFKAAATGRGLTDESLAAAEAIFPDPGDIADSVLRYLVTPAGDAQFDVEFAEPVLSDLISLISSTLGRLSIAASHYPELLDAVLQHPPTHPPGVSPFIEKLTDGIAGALLRAPDIDCADPVRTAKDLVQLTLDGPHGWRGVEAVLHALKPRGTADI